MNTLCQLEIIFYFCTTFTQTLKYIFMSDYANIYENDPLSVFITRLLPKM